MKKAVLFLVVILSLLQTQKIHAQPMAVIDAFVLAAVEKTGADQAIATAQMIWETVQQGVTMYSQLQHLIQLAEDSLENFKKLERRKL